jgi:hypothetical protein
MKKIKSCLIILICVISVPFFAQDCDKGCCKLIKTTPDNSIPAGKAKLHIFFSGPDHKVVKSHVKFVLGKDTLNPKINAKGVYQIYVRPDTYKMKFKAPWWYVVKKDGMQIKAGNTYNMTVHFEAKEIMGKGKDNWD